ncbi:MAG TPA: hypothetical protein VK934_05435 [Fimbriimonas sp.]|nr:hypothetical protein [Fimbriimonas sp.]
MKKLLLGLILASLGGFSAAADQTAQTSIYLNIASYMAVSITSSSHVIAITGGGSAGSTVVSFHVDSNVNWSVSPALTGSGGPGTFSVSGSSGTSGTKNGGNGSVTIGVTGITLNDSPQGDTAARTLTLTVSPGT